MTESIRIYPTDTPGLYRSEDNLNAVRLRTSPSDLFWCVHCLQLLETPSYQHWYIGSDRYCCRCVVVADQEEAA